MPLRSTKPSSGDQENCKRVNWDARDMVSSIMSRISGLHKSTGSSSTREEEDDDRGVRMIMLGGTNVGATMRGDLDSKLGPNFEGVSLGEANARSTYVNSNFQAINNSIMMDGSYSDNDPGVHIDISDFVEQKCCDQPEENCKTGKKKEEDGPWSVSQTESSDCA